MKNIDIMYSPSMSDRDRKIMIDAMKAYQKKVLASPEASRLFLIELGVITKKGNIRKRYKHLITKK